MVEAVNQYSSVHPLLIALLGSPDPPLWRIGLPVSASDACGPIEAGSARPSAINLTHQAWAVADR